jgi:colanic acid biosynthesis glycosyl transferase WcaI
MRVLFINRYFYPDHAPTGVLLSDLAFALSQQGVHVAVISSRSRYGGGDSLSSPRETLDGVDIYRVWTPRLGRYGLFGRALDYGSFYLAGGWRLWRLAGAGDVVVAKTDPPMLSVIAALTARPKKARVVNWLQDIFPEVAEALGVGGRLGQTGFRLLRPLRNWSLRVADTNVAVGDAMAAHLKKEEIAPEKTRVISNWADGAKIVPIAPTKNDLRKKWGLSDRFVVGYAGNLGRAHDVDTIIEAMTVLHDRATNSPPDDVARQIMFVFVGGGAQHAKLAREVSRRQLKVVQMHPYQPQERLAEILGVADVHLVSLNPKLEGLIVPSKFYGIAAAGRPALFIGASDGEIARLINQSDSGLIISPGDAEALTCRILQLADDPKLCAAMGARARAAFEKHWDKKRAAEQWMEVLKVTAWGADGDRNRPMIQNHASKKVC